MRTSPLSHLYLGLYSLIVSCVFANTAVATDPEIEKFTAEAQARISQFILPEDLAAELYADTSQTQNPSSICFDRKGNLYVAEIHRWLDGTESISKTQRLLRDDLDNVTLDDRVKMIQRDKLSRPVSHYQEQSDRIVVIKDTDGDGRADQSSIYADGFSEILDGAGLGLVAHEDGSIYYANTPHLWQLQDTNADNVADIRTSVQAGFGVRMGEPGHSLHGLIVGPDGKLYFSIGDRGYHITTMEGRHFSKPYHGAIFRCNPDGSNLEEYYSGLHNPQELAFDQFGNLFTVDNNATHGEPCRLVYILEGGDSGWHVGHQSISQFAEKLRLRTPTYTEENQQKHLCAWYAERLWDLNFAARPNYALPPCAHIGSIPTGLVFNYGITALPDRYKDHFFLSNFGNDMGTIEAFTIESKGAGFTLGKHESPFMVGIGNTDIEFGADGKLYLSSFSNGTQQKQDVGNIYTLFDPTKLNSERLRLTNELLKSDLTTTSENHLRHLMGFPDMRVRQRSQFELVRRNSQNLLLDALKQTKHRLTRLHAVWGLGQIAQTEPELYDHHLTYLTDKDPEIRAQCAKILSDSRLSKFGEALSLSMTSDKNAKVKAFAAIGAGKCSAYQSIPDIFQLLATNDNKDPFLRHSCIQALWYLNDKETILRSAEHSSAAVRLGILLTLRKLEDPRVSYFLNDEDKLIRHSATRAISDLNLFTAIPSLALKLDKYINKEYTTSDTPADWMMQHRLIHANYLEGSISSANRLLNYIKSSHLPKKMRIQALDALIEWNDPSAFDPTVGLYRPIDPMQRTEITRTIRSSLPKIFKQLNQNQSNALIGKMIQLASNYQCTVPEPQLLQLIQEEGFKPTRLRIDAMDLLSKQTSKHSGVWNSLLESPSPAIRVAASEMIMREEPSKGLAIAFRLGNSASVKERQLLYKMLTKEKSSEVTDFFADRLDNINSELPGSVLDLLDAIDQRSEPSLQRALEIYREEVPPDTVTSYEPCLNGGDSAKGELVFLSHKTGACATCHRFNENGGDIGPELTKMAVNKSPEKLLRLFIGTEPNHIADNHNIVGTMSKRELRDLIAFLHSQTNK